MARDRRRAALPHEKLIAELDDDLNQAIGAGGVQLALFHLQQVVDSLAEARRRWDAAQFRARKAARVLGKLAIPHDRYGRQLARAIQKLRDGINDLMA